MFYAPRQPVAYPDTPTRPTEVVVFCGSGGGTVAGQALRNGAAAGSPQRLLGFLDDTIAPGTLVLSAPVLGAFASWKDLDDDVRFVAPVHRAGRMVERAAIVRNLGVPHERWTTVIDPRADLPDDLRIGTGCLVSACAVLQPGCVVGNHVAIRNGASVGHDCTFGDFSFVGTNSSLCGYVRVGEGAHISPGAVVRERVRIGDWAVVGIGAVVLSDVPDGAVVAGNPARRIESLGDG